MRATIVRVCACAACMPTAGLPASDPADALQVHVDAGLARDSNLFRLPDGFTPREVQGRSDTMLVRNAGLKLDRPIGRQRVIAEASVSETTFERNRNLDHVGHDGRLAWQWRVGSDWDGEIGVRRKRTLAGFADQILREKDLLDAAHYRLSAGYMLDARWKLGAELSYEDQSHTAASRRVLDFDAKAAGLGIGYRTPAESSIGVHARRTGRSYPNRFDPAFGDNHTEDRLDVVGSWKPTGRLRIDAQAGYVGVDHDRLRSRDFSGATWRLGGSWNASAKLGVDVAGFRDLRLYEDLAAGYIAVRGISVTPTFALTAKVSLQGELAYEDREFRPSSQREDRFRLARLALGHSPLRNIRLSLTYEAGERRSNGFADSYDYQSLFGAASIAF